MLIKKTRKRKQSCKIFFGVAHDWKFYKCDDYHIYLRWHETLYEAFLLRNLSIEISQPLF